jgi:ABC-2 type transport system permease protein
MWRRIREIIRKEFRQTLREPRMRMVLVGPPLVQLIVFGFAVNLDVEDCRLGWMDLDRTAESRALRAAFEGSPNFRVAATPVAEEEVRELMDHGSVQAVVRVLPGFGRDIDRGTTAQVQLLVDGTNSNTASVISGYASRVVAEFGNKLQERQQRARLVGRTAQAGGPVNLDMPALQARSRVWFNEDLLSRNYFVPGVVVNIIALVTLMLTAMAIVREKEIGTMEQLMVTPIRPPELILGKTLPFALVGFLDVLLITGAALLVFRVPFRGSFLVLLGCAALFLMTTLGVGLFISTVSHTQQQAMMGSFFFFTPAFMLNGFAFPIRNMPEPVQYLTLLNPVRYFMEIVRGVFLKGVGAEVLWPQMLALLIIGVAILALSALRFRKRLD